LAHLLLHTQLTSDVRQLLLCGFSCPASLVRLFNRFDDFRLFNLRTTRSFGGGSSVAGGLFCQLLLPTPGLIFRHLLPNALAPVLVSASFGVAYAILTESALSFLGLGVPLPTATWGSILASAKQFIEYAWWLVVFPGVAIFLTVAAFNIIGDRFRDALDPRSD